MSTTSRSPLAGPLATVTRAAWRVGARRRRPPVYVSGAPRSGTTWLLETLEDLLPARRHWEPIRGLQESLRPAHARYGGISPAFATDDDLPLLRRFLIDALADTPPAAPHRMHAPKLGRLGSLVRLATAEVSILKFTEAQRLLPWIVRTCPNPGVVLLRNPLAVVASVPGMERWPAGANAEPVTLAFDDGTLAQFPELAEVQGTTVSRIEEVAWWIVLDTLAPLRDGRCRDDLAFVAYEALVRDEGLFFAVADALGCGDLIRRRSVPRRPSDTTIADSNVVRGGDPTQSWRHRLQPWEIATVARVMARLGIDFYDSDGGYHPHALARRGLARHLG